MLSKNVFKIQIISNDKQYKLEVFKHIAADEIIFNELLFYLTCKI